MSRKKMSDHLNILGIDIGSVAIAIAEITPEREIIKTAYKFHHGNIPETFTEIINEFPMDSCHIINPVRYQGGTQV
jgi:activator of 2-hydroxyglutaryl-CoA dehydratase